ncbi:hypothetical protein JHK87_048988 [Glycine soja]|nr:hypothetical protein JHK87_048988 [Glycine soja]
MDYQGRLLVFILLSFLLRGESWGWFSSSKETPSSDKTHTTNEGNFRGSSAEFSIESFNDHKGVKLIENAKKKMISSNSCWQNAYQHLFAGCSEILAVDEKRSRLAWHLSDCFQRDSGRSPFPHCDPKSSIAVCSRSLDDLAHKVYLEFYLETNTICYQLQTHAFKYETERLVTELKSSAQYVEDKLDSIEEKSEHLLQGSRQIHDSLDSIGSHTKQVAQTAKNLEGHIDSVLTHSKSVYEQTTKIALSQTQLKEGQENMKRNLEDGVGMLKDSYNYLGREIEKLRNEAIEIENEVIKVGDAMSSKMDNLQSKAEDIGNMAEISLDKQQILLDGQSAALEGLNSLTESQAKALEESRKTLQYFAEYGHRQHEELLQRQQQIQGFHDRLMENSKEILSSQNDQSFLRLFRINLCHLHVDQYKANIQYQTIPIYWNYETLNHQMLLTLINKVNSMQKEKELSWDLYTDYEDWSEWIDADLPDDVNCLDDPDYILPQEVAENSITVTKNYNLRNRNLFH